MKPSAEGLVFDIKRFAVHDGDGIRTTVFFKGCPLRCKWCQNPEGLEAKKSVLWLSSKCIHCGLCEANKLEGQMTFQDGSPVLNRSYAGSFDNLVNACPSGALCYDSKIYDVETLMKRVKDDKVFFRNGGGVTFSGGEPLLHKDFLVEVLKECQSEGIETAIETALNVPNETVQTVLPYLSQVFADLKIFDEDAHIRYTGVSNEQIKANLRYVLESEKRSVTTVRTPLIPGMTASKENIRAIAEYLASIYPAVRYELLNYNDLAPAKYPMTGKTYGVSSDVRRFTEAEMQEFKSAAQDAGLINVF